MEMLLNSWSFVNILFLICTLRVYGQFFGNPKVTTSLGDIIGSYVRVDDTESNRIKDVEQYLGVPFAKPPIGDLRFRKPEPVEPWNCTILCKSMPKACYQPESWFLWYRTDVLMSEDCLYLNIWVPNDASPENKKSVLFFVYGGGFIESRGSVSHSVYEGHVLAAVGDIIVVTANYRVGVFGFWTNNGTDAPGNAGIWDIIEALRWVNNHIESFGGNKDSITLAGQGAGAVYVTLLAVTPHARGLFQRQIVQSGSAILEMYDDPISLFYISIWPARLVRCAKAIRPFRNESNIYTRLDIEGNLTDITKCMKEMHVTWLADFSESSYPALPIWGDELFPTNPKEALLAGNFSFSELFIGISGNEGASFLTVRNPTEFGKFGEKAPTYNRSAAETLTSNTFVKPTRVAMINESYFPVLSKLNENKVDYKVFVAEALGDFQTVCPTVFYAAASGKAGVKVYFYDFEYRPIKSRWAGWVGPTHFDEVNFVFGGPLKSSEYYDEDEVHISNMMIKHWSRFVKEGKPTSDWPRFDSLLKTMVYTGARKPEKVRGLLYRRCKLWREHQYPSYEMYLPDHEQ